MGALRVNWEIHCRVFAGRAELLVLVDEEEGVFVRERTRTLRKMVFPINKRRMMMSKMRRHRDLRFCFFTLASCRGS